MDVRAGRSVLVAPDGFKGSLGAQEVADALAEGLREGGGAGLVVDTLPLADGGDGSIEAALRAGFAPVEVTVPGPTGVPGRALLAERDGTVVVEVASTCGMARLPGGVLRPLEASSAGLGVALREALRRGPERVVLALGGSAGTDGGLGMLTALGATDVDTDHPGGGHLEALTVLRLDDLDPPGVELVVATDVTNPLLGARGAAAVFAPQKGADPATVARLERGLAHLVAVAGAARADAEELAATPGAGAAGGLGFAGLLLGGRVVSGAELFLDLLGFDAAARGRDLVLTGEGRLDEQTLHGKLPGVVAARAGTRVEAVVGRSTVDAGTAERLGIAAVHELVTRTDADPAHDPVLTRRLLVEVGREVGERLSAPDRPGGRAES
ncbi:glycerate kinase [Phycicoccus sonneratiae]|uniref:Glycerate kinase n=1 Tax=Phycicoccus sonneratiae TaxID=2807628 RepID=A0ABS2CQU5_9MICO|nr:glycerate kinase [Phycicoccus sonneraticus]MBM6402261.1 glycerate kinase [Phycicoccus sonneraticus]